MILPAWGEGPGGCLPAGQPAWPRLHTPPTPADLAGCPARLLPLGCDEGPLSPSPCGCMSTARQKEGLHSPQQPPLTTFQLLKQWKLQGWQVGSSKGERQVKKWSCLPGSDTSRGQFPCSCHVTMAQHNYLAAD